MHRALRSLGVLALVTTVGVSVAHAAVRHLRLLKSSPIASATLPTSPDAVRLWLSEPAEAAGSTVALTTEAGASIPLSPITRDAAKTAPLVAKLSAPLANGGYRVAWKAMSKDGHVVKGTFAFRVGAAR